MNLFSSGKLNTFYKLTAKDWLDERKQIPHFIKNY